jgi:hypothetical protein
MEDVGPQLLVDSLVAEPGYVMTWMSGGYEVLPMAVHHHHVTNQAIASMPMAVVAFGSEHHFDPGMQWQFWQLHVLKTLQLLVAAASPLLFQAPAEAAGAASNAATAGGASSSNASSSNASC